LNGDDLRRDPLEVRKATLTYSAGQLRLNEHMEHDDGKTVFRHACKLGLEGIVNKRNRVKLMHRPPVMKWHGHPNLSRRPATPSKGRGPVQRLARRALLVLGTASSVASFRGVAKALSARGCEDDPRR
jgi:hypothetical protein